jgi:hypothetical protein
MTPPNYHFNREELVKARDAIRVLPSIIRMSVVADLIDYCLHHFGGSGEHGKSYNSALDSVEKMIIDKLDYANTQVEALVENKEFHEAARCAIEADTHRQLLYDVARMRV